MRRATKLPLEQLQPYLIDLSKAGLLDWQMLFGNSNPVEIEVGFGKGMFLVSAAEADAGVNYLGIEIERKYYLYAANRIAKRGLANVRLACGDARTILRDQVASNSVRMLHVYFPDPWWKNRHRKRRLMTADFIKECERVLVPGGRLRLLTDVEEYFHETTKLIAGTPLQAKEPPAAREPMHDLDYVTNFERKYRKENRPIYRAEYEK